MNRRPTTRQRAEEDVATKFVREEPQLETAAIDAVSQEDLMANLCNPPKPGCPDYVAPTPDTPVQAGFGKIPVAVWVVFRCGCSIFCRKKTKVVLINK